MWFNSIIETIGNTPLVKLGNITESNSVTMLAKVEYFNPGQSVKDRIALKMIEDAEREGKLKPGSTIIEGTSGNTGMGLALAAAIKGYNCIFTTTDKQSMEKVNMLRALGSEVKVCPTNVEPDDPRSYYSVAKRLNEEIPNSWYPNQYDNPSNSQAHYETTGPEIWEQTDGKITHFVAGMGTGGTISGTARYLKEKNPDIKIIGIDPVGSVYKSYHKTRKFDKRYIAPYLTEGIGEDIIPQNMDFDLIDEVIQCSDKDAFLTTRALARREGLFVGGSCGSAVWGAIEYAKKYDLTDNDLMVVLLPDSGTRYVSKIYNDEWMVNNGFMDESTSLTAIDILKMKDAGIRPLISVKADDSLGKAISVMSDEDISQLPVLEGDKVIGSLYETQILNHLVDDSSAKERKVTEVMGKAFPVVSSDIRLAQISKMMDKNNPAVLVKLENNSMQILTRSDLINAISNTKEKES
ncbi:MAG TPA: cystathionine beta-synthase [Balneolales bacterium]|nr:cystathionine beta-synthase [Balneolales bacterium]